MGKTPQCFGCNRWAKVEDCVLLRNKKSGIRRWFHSRTRGAKDCAGLVHYGYWEEVDRSLGETTVEEERRLAGLNK